MTYKEIETIQASILSLEETLQAIRDNSSSETKAAINNALRFLQGAYDCTHDMDKAVSKFNC